MTCLAVTFFFFQNTSLEKKVSADLFFLCFKLISDVPYCDKYDRFSFMSAEQQKVYFRELNYEMMRFDILKPFNEISRRTIGLMCYISLWCLVEVGITDLNDTFHMIMCYSWKRS